MGETAILDDLYKELRLDRWWEELIGQTPVYEGFDYDKAVEALPRTEILSSKVIADKFKNRLTYTEASSKWFIWDGRIHTPCDGEGIALKVVKIYFEQVCKALKFIQDVCYKEAEKVRTSGITNADKEAEKIRAYYDKGVFVKYRSFRDRLSTDAGMSAMIRVMRTDCDVPSDYFDNDKRWFVMRNWVLDLDDVRTEGKFTFLPHSPERPVTKYFDADYDPSMNLGHWDGFLQRSIPNETVRNYLQMVVGAAFMGESKLRCILNVSGPPGSGKSVFLGALFKLGKQGAGYAASPDSRAITKVNGQNFEQDNFKGRRFIGISEPSSTEKIDDDFLKKFTGDDWVETRTLNVKSTGWVPQGVVFVASNQPLKINTRDKAIVERVQLVEFPISFEKDHPDIEKRIIPGIEDMIQEDASHVLTWILLGMYKYVKDGRKLNPPAEVIAKRDEIVTEASTALRWVEDYVEEGMLTIDYTVDLEHCISVVDAYTRYTMWAQHAGEKKPLTRRFFKQDIENKYNDGNKTEQGKFFGLVPTKEYRAKYDAIPDTTDIGRFDTY